MCEIRNLKFRSCKHMVVRTRIPCPFKPERVSEYGCPALREKWVVHSQYFHGPCSTCLSLRLLEAKRESEARRVQQEHWSAPTSCVSLPSLAASAGVVARLGLMGLEWVVYVVTGGSAGIGFGILAHLLEHSPAKVYLLSNKEDHADQAMQELKKYGDAENVEWVKCDLADIKATDEVAKKLKGDLSKLDGLVCNAGLGVGKYSMTKDNLEAHFQVNHLSQMHLLLTLLPVLQSTPQSRIVLQSSEFHRMAPSDVKFASVSEVNTDVGPANLYHRTKLAQVLFVRALVRRMAEKKLGFQNVTQVYANAVHPGGVSTDQPEQAVEAYGWLGKAAVTAFRPLMADPIEQGCRPALFATTSQDIVADDIQGQYIVPDRKVTDPSKQAQDDALGEHLWKLSEEILLEKLSTLPYKTSAL
ncbi:MAG: hypothetical protein M1832_002123 [Thelocarpon impressellum]|nr:MAG: hypothetical protein M1832_002123 [Thelocarpon impressellum]